MGQGPITPEECETPHAAATGVEIRPEARVDDDPIEIARDRGYTEMERLLAHTLETKFNASPKGEPVALSLRDHDLKQMTELLDAEARMRYFAGVVIRWNGE